MRIITVASRSWNSDNANAVTAAIANPPRTLTSSGRSNAAWRNITSIAIDKGTLVISRVAKQRTASPRRMPSGPIVTQSVKQPYPIVATHKADAGNGRTTHNRELSGRLIRKEATAAEIPVARAPSMPITKNGCRRQLEKSGRTPCAMAMRPRIVAANASQSPARTIGGRRRRTGVAVSTSASMRSGVLVTSSHSAA